MTVYLRALTAFTAIVLAGCEPELKTQSVSGTMPPGKERIYKVGDEVLLREKDGTEKTLRVTSVRDSLVEIIKVGTDCRATFQMQGFAPAVDVDACGGTAIERTVEATGSIYPMTLGSREEWTIVETRGKKKTGPYKRVCSVDETAVITVPAGTFDTYVVRCSDKFRDVDFYFAPSIGIQVLLRQTQKRNNSFYSEELVKLTPGT